jgi:hypothetical protein
MRKGNKLTGRILFWGLVSSLSLVACTGPMANMASDRSCESYGSFPVCGLILTFYRQHNGVELLGYPITNQRVDNGVQLQYFEKGIVQYPAVNRPKYDQVRLRPLGLLMSELTPPVAPEEDPDCRYFERYGHVVCMHFLSFFDRVGGTSILGHPISEPRMENGVLTQDFENARLRWDTNDLAPRVSLDKWGQQACHQDEQVCFDNRSPIDIVSPTDQFVAEHGGAAVFGDKVSAPARAGDRVLQCYQNACLVWTTEQVTLVPLGGRNAPQVAPVEPPPPCDDVWYCPETGHSVILAFKDFYLKHGGEAVFGKPLTEFMRDGEGWVQWFENVSFEWHPDRPDGERVQLTPLGEISYQAFGNRLFHLPPQPDAAEEHVTLTLRPDYSLLLADTPQTVHVKVQDSAGQPLPNLPVTLYVTTLSSRQTFDGPTTDASGEVQLRFDGLQASCGEIVRLRAVTQVADSLAWINGQFTFWCESQP